MKSSLAKPRLLRLSESICINTVEDAFKQLIRKQHNSFPKLGTKPGSKTARNCFKLVELARSQKRPVSELLNEALAFFNPEFCQRVFRKDYPSLSMLICEKTQEKLVLQSKPALRVTNVNVESIADQYMDILTNMDKTMAIEAVRGGWPADAPQVRKELLRRLRA